MLLARLGWFASFGWLDGLVRLAWLGRVTRLAGIRLARRLEKLPILSVLVPFIRQVRHLYSLLARRRQTEGVPGT